MASPPLEERVLIDRALILRLAEESLGLLHHALVPTRHAVAQRLRERLPRARHVPASLQALALVREGGAQDGSLVLVAGAHLLGFRNLVHRQLVLALLDQGERDAIVRRRDEFVLAQHVEPLDRLTHPPARPLRVTLRSMNLAERHEQIAHPPVEVGSHERGHARSAVVRLAQRQALLQRRLRRLQLAFLHVSVGQHAHREAVHRRRGDDFGAQLVGAVHHLDGPLEVAVVQRGSRVLHGPHDQRGNLLGVQPVHVLQSRHVSFPILCLSRTPR
mmetsp:Transcript_164/g.766  ORF Transcript_164/g.766 Transcript_164/m.766 type:complete len:274 (-) Transcript_164:212-1033(-)